MDVGVWLRALPWLDEVKEEEKEKEEAKEKGKEKRGNKDHWKSGKSGRTDKGKSGRSDKGRSGECGHLDELASIEHHGHHATNQPLWTPSKDVPGQMKKRRMSIVDVLVTGDLSSADTHKVPAKDKTIQRLPCSAFGTPCIASPECHHSLIQTETLTPEIQRGVLSSGIQRETLPRDDPEWIFSGVGVFSIASFSGGPCIQSSQGTRKRLLSFRRGNQGRDSGGYDHSSYRMLDIRVGTLKRHTSSEGERKGTDPYLGNGMEASKAMGATEALGGMKAMGGMKGRDTTYFTDSTDSVVLSFGVKGNFILKGGAIQYVEAALTEGTTTQPARDEQDHGGHQMSAEQARECSPSVTLHLPGVALTLMPLQRQMDHHMSMDHPMNMDDEMNMDHQMKMNPQMKMDVPASWCNVWRQEDLLSLRRLYSALHSESSHGKDLKTLPPFAACLPIQLGGEEAGDKDTALRSLKDWAAACAQLSVNALAAAEVCGGDPSLTATLLKQAAMFSTTASQTLHLSS